MIDKRKMQRDELIVLKILKVFKLLKMDLPAKKVLCKRRVNVPSKFLTAAAPPCNQL